MIIGKAAGGKGSTDFSIGHARVFLPKLLKGRVLVALCAFLLKIANGNKFTAFHGSRNGRDLAEEGL